MSASSQSLDTLLQQLRNYRHSDAVRRHVSQLTSMLPSLVPTIGTISLGNTRSSSLCLQGTIPVYYKANRYNIPINIWILEDYPYRAPMVYVTPTENMAIKPGHASVEHTGKCNIRYMAEWNVRTNSLYELVNHLSAVFGADPPVFQKPVTQPLPQTRTPPPPYGVAQQQQIPPPQQYQLHPQYAQHASGYQQRLPPPQQYQQRPPPPQQYQQRPPPPQQYQQHPSQYQQQHQHPQHQQQHRHVPPPAQNTQRTSSNPSYLRRELNGKINNQMNKFLQEFVKKTEQEMDSQTKLNARAEVLKEQERKLNEDHENFKDDIRNQTEKIENMTKWIEENKDAEVDIDNVINPNGIHAKQILDCVAEDIAIDDLFYNLDKALQNDIISLDKYLKSVRKYARIQFENRALAKKIHSLQQGVKH